MRNLKKVLALVLALVMAMSLVTIANASDFSDDADISYDEAVDVMVAAGIIDGVGNNSFDPNGTLTREQAAKLVTYMLLGENSDKLGIESSSFKDVAVTRWSAPAIEYCASLGIIDGAGDGNFYPAGKLTGYAFAKMLLTAIGYDSQTEKFVGAGWTIPVATIGMTAGLNDGLEEMFGADEITRQEAAQMALNCIKSPLVEYVNNNTININGSDVSFGNKTASYVTTTIARQQNISKDTQTNSSDAAPKYLVEFGEKYLPKLERIEDIDAFGRPSYTWSYDKKEIGTYVDSELLDYEFTKEITGKDVYDVLGSNVVDNYSFTITIDGVEVGKRTGNSDNDDVLNDFAGAYFDETYFTKTYNRAIGATGNGTLTQIFVDSLAKHVDIAVINTYLAKATTNYSEKRDDVTFEVFAINYTGADEADRVWYKVVDACTNGVTKDSKNITIAGEDFDIAKDVKKDDIYLVNVANGSIEIMMEPEVMAAATLTSFAKDDYVVSDGKQYDYSTTLEYDPTTLDDYTSISSTQQLKDTQYNMFLDPYGYLVGIEVVEATKNYIFLTGIDQGTSNLKNKTANAAGILLDGTFVEFTMDLDDSVAYYNHGGLTAQGTPFTTVLDDVTYNRVPDGSFSGGPLWNTWCTYTVDKDGVYTLTEVKHEEHKYTDKAAQYHDGAVYARGAAAAVDADGKVINDKNVSLKSTSTTYVYGNDSTVYLVAGLKNVASDTSFDAGDIKNVYDGTDESNSAVTRQTSRVGIIGDVDSVATGITNVDLVTWNYNQINSELIKDGFASADAISSGTYALYDNDGYIIAAVVVGEDNGSSKNLVYSHKSSLKRESYSAANDEWTWERLVISNGEEITLTEVGSKLASGGLRTMGQNVWYEVTYKGNGTVKSVEHVQYTDTGKSVGRTQATSMAMTRSDGSTNSGDFVDDIDNLEYAINESNKSTVLYEEAWGAQANNPSLGLSKRPSLIGSTLYVDTASSKGFYVNSAVKSVLIQRNNSKNSTTYYDGISELEGMLDNLNEIGDKFNFKVSAIMTNGRATVVIIHDWNETEGKTNDKETQLKGITEIETNLDDANRTPTYDGRFDAAIKSQKDGVYKVDYAKSTWASDVVASDILHFKFTADGTSNAILTIMSGKTVVYSEEATTPAAGPHYFSVHVKNSCNAAHRHYDAAAWGKLVTDGKLAAGIYTYSITVGDKDVVSGEFTVTNR